MKKILKLLIVPLIALSLTLVPATVSAASSISEACSGLTQLDNNGTTCNAGQSSKRVNSIVQTAINIISYVVGVASVVVIIIAGFRFVTAGGDSNTISSARTQILYAIIGLIVVAVAQIVSRVALHVGNKVNGIILYYPHIRI